MKTTTNAHVRFPMTTSEDFEVTGSCHLHQDILRGGESCYTCVSDQYAYNLVMAERAVINASEELNLDAQASLAAEYFVALDLLNYHRSLAPKPVVCENDNDLPF